MRKNSVIAAGLPHSFREEVASALAVDSSEIAWVQSMPAVEEYLMRANTPVDLIVLSPEVHEPDALPMVEFVTRTSPRTAIILVREHMTSGLLPAAMRVGIRDVVDSTQGAGALREAINRAMESTGTPKSEVGHLLPNGYGQVVGPSVIPGSAIRHESGPKAESTRPSTLRDRTPRTRRRDRQWWQKIRIAAAIVGALLGYLYLYVIAPSQLDVRYCEQFLSVMQETHDLTSAPTSEQAQQFKTAVEELARLNDGDVTFPGAGAAAALIRDTNEAAGSPTGENILAVSRDADALVAACHDDTA